MEFVKEARPQIMALVIALFFLFAAVFIYFTPVNIDNKTNYDMPVSKLI